MILIAQVVLLCIAGFAKSIMHTLQFHFNLSVFSALNPKFWNPEISWIRKYKIENGIYTTKPRFFGSTSILILFTDAWHLFQFIFLNSFGLAMALSSNITQYIVLDFLIIRGCIGLFFWIGYNKILLKK